MEALRLHPPENMLDIIGGFLRFNSRPYQGDIRKIIPSYINRRNPQNIAAAAIKKSVRVSLHGNFTATPPSYL